MTERSERTRKHGPVVTPPDEGGLTTALWAVDAGGSTTTAVLPGAGEVRTYGSVNPASVGAGPAARTLRDLFGDVAAALDGRDGTGWIATAAVDLDVGADEPLRLRDLARAAGVRGRLLVSNDCVPWLVAPPLSGRGVVLVCGTGSGFAAADGADALCRVGGCEYLGSDEGSAFTLGLDGLRAAVRAVDGRGSATAIAARLTGLAGGRSPVELARALAAEAFPKAAVAALAPAVCDAWLDGDAVAASLVSAAVGELVLGVRAARDRAGLTGAWSVAAGGGVLRGCPPFLAELDRRLCTEAGAAEVVPVDRPAEAVYAALRSLARDDGEVRPPASAVGHAVRSLDLDPREHRTPPANAGDPADGPLNLHPANNPTPPANAANPADEPPDPHPPNHPTPPANAANPADKPPGLHRPNHRARSARRPLRSPGDRPVGVGLCLAAWGGSRLDTALEHAARCGVDAVDLPTDSTSGLVDLVRWARDREHRAELRAAVAGTAVECVSNSRDSQLLLGPHGPHTDPVLAGSAADKREHALRSAMDTVRLAADLGAPHVRLMYGVPDVARWLSWWHSAVSWADNIALWCEEARPILRLAAEHGVTLLVEPHPKQVVYDRASARQLLDAAAETEPSASVRLCVDPANLAATGHDPVDAVRGWGAGLGAAHAKDLQRWGRPEPPPGAGWSRYGPGPPIRFRALGAGEMPWPAIVSALLDEDFRGVLYVEHEDALLPREQSTTASVRLLRDLLPQSGPQGRTW
ncbi:TIM barrel protein [Actinoallomurus iriomotensis]|uniref:TIM barrel protein n=1 Tax=Actinoallomurus iriomotensis TaxID=478107 RepID=UPI002553B72C|nr:TIM barrel protein [Actinoallomurus iriomotensis]